MHPVKINFTPILLRKSILTLSPLSPCTNIPCSPGALVDITGCSPAGEVCRRFIIDTFNCPMNASGTSANNGLTGGRARKVCKVMACLLLTNNGWFDRWLCPAETMKTQTRLYGDRDRQQKPLLRLYGSTELIQQKLLVHRQQRSWHPPTPQGRLFQNL